MEWKNGILVGAVSVNLGKDKNMIFADNKAIAEARYPNQRDYEKHVGRAKNLQYYKDLDLDPLWYTEGDIQIVATETAQQTADLSQPNDREATSEAILDQPVDFWKGARIVSVHGFGWGAGTADVTGSEPGKLFINNGSQQFYFKHAYATDSAYLTGTKNAIDLPGEWAVENGLLYIYPQNGEKAGQDLNIEIKARQLVVDLTDKSYVQIDGFKTIGGGAKVTGEMCVLKNMDMRYISHYTYTADTNGVAIETADGMNTDEASYRGENGLYIAGKNNAFVDGKISFSAGSGLFMTGRYHFVKNNSIEDTGYMGNYACGIMMFPEPWKGITYPTGGHTVLYNTIVRTGRSAISTGAYEPWRTRDLTQVGYLPSEIAYNEMTDNSIIGRDTGSFYQFASSLGGDALRSRHHHNIVSNSMNIDQKIDMIRTNAPIYYDLLSDQVESYNNMAFYTDEALYFMPYEKVLTYGQYASVDEWNNKFVGYLANGLDTSNSSNYPNKQIFAAGCRMGTEKNYNTNWLSRSKEEFKYSFSARNAKLSDGVTFVNNGARFSGDSQWITFENVEIPASGEAYLTIRENENAFGDFVEIIVGSDMDTGEIISDRIITQTTGVYPYATSDLKVNYRLSAWTQKMMAANGGKTNVFVRVKDYHSLEVTGMEFVAQGMDGAFAAQVFGEELDEVYTEPGVTPTSAEADTTYFGTTKARLRDTWAGNTVLFKDVEVKADTKVFTYSACTEGQWSGGIVEVRVGSRDSEPIVTSVMEQNNFYDYRVREIEMDNVLKKGTYDIYLTFEVPGKSTNFGYFGFIADINDIN